MTARLDTLNALRATVGKPALKGWKESNAKLEAAIAALTPKLDKEPKAADKRAAKADIKADRKRTKQDAAPSNALGKLLAELGINGKVARAKLRRAGLAAPYTDMKRIREILTK